MYIDTLIRIKNAQQARKRSVKFPFAKMDMAILEVLASKGYIDEVQKHGRLPKRVLEVRLAYPEGKGAITGLRFVSKPSRRLYAGYREMRKVKNGYGLAVLTTPKGILTGPEARAKKVGGQVLFEIW